MCLGYVQGDTAQAQDLAQEVFINVWNALPKFRGESGLQTWLYRIAVNTCLLHLRQKKRKPEIAAPEDVAAATATDDNDIEDGSFTELYQAIGRLEELDRLIIMLVLEEIDYDEIARIVNVSPATLRVKIHRAKQRLKKLLNQPHYG